MSPLAATLAIVGIFLVLTWLVASAGGLAFLAPRSTGGIRASASAFCAERCRVDGRCPMTGSAERWDSCPLFKYVSADFPTELHGSPFRGGPR